MKKKTDKKPTRRRNRSTCPRCGSPIEATVPCYLSNVTVDKDGFITSYELAFESLDSSINRDEPEKTQIYCKRNHPFPLPAEAEGSQRASTNRARP